ncbi:MAG: DUF2093 domain-containing protein [Pseudomonadota bacterium]
MREAKLVYEAAGVRILVPGDYVLCAVTGARIPLEALRYWNAELQEAYVDAQAASARHRQRHEARPEEAP